MKRIIKVIFNFTVIIFLISLSEDSFAFKVSTHSEITKGALARSQNYNRFINDFNIDGTSAVIDGSKKEDGENDADRRWFNHYYDPVNQRGLDLPTTQFDGRNLKEWGYDGGSGPSRYRPCLTCEPYTNDFSWINAREYMYIALTGKDFNGNLIAQIQTERNEYFQKMFRSVGQVVHLVEDLAQPSHVRNDPHVSHGEFPILPYILNPSRLEDWAQDNSGLINSYTGLAGIAKSLPSFDNYFVGLASLVNINFFSDDTIFKHYALPSKDQTDIGDFTFNTPLATVIDEDGTESTTIYVTKTGGSRTGYKVAHAGYFAINLNMLGYNTLSGQYQIDDRVAQENAEVFIPLAVEFSAGLINYFFRGQINMITDTVTSGQYIIENLSSETMNGTFSLYYDDVDGNRLPVPNVDWSNVNDINLNGDNNGTATITFTPPASPNDPAPKEPGKYILVFKGKLGNEVGAVVGKVVSLEAGPWEDWEAGIAGKHPWGFSLYDDISFEVVDGFVDNTTKVLKISGADNGSSIRTFFEEPAPIPKKMSFDYYAESLGTYAWDFGALYLRIKGNSGGLHYRMDLHIANPSWYTTGCYQSSGDPTPWGGTGWIWNWCTFAVESGRWVHVEIPVSDFGEIDGVYFIVEGSNNAYLEIYIDNIDFEW